MMAKTPAAAKTAAKSIGEVWEVKEVAKSHDRRAPMHRPAKATHSLFQRMFRRAEPTIFHRCLAIHMHNAQAPSALK